MREREREREREKRWWEGVGKGYGGGARQKVRQSVIGRGKERDKGQRVEEREGGGYSE